MDSNANNLVDSDWPTDQPEHHVEVLARVAMEEARARHLNRISGELGGESDFHRKFYQHQANSAKAPLTRAINRAKDVLPEAQIKAILGAQEKLGQRKAWMDLAKSSQNDENQR